MSRRRPKNVKNVEIENENSLDDIISTCCTEIEKVSNSLKLLIQSPKIKRYLKKCIKKSSVPPRGIKTEELYEEKNCRSDTPDNEQSSDQSDVEEKNLDRFERLENMRERACKRRASESESERSQRLEDLRKRAAARRASETPAEREKRLKAMKLRAAKKRM